MFVNDQTQLVLPLGRVSLSPWAALHRNEKVGPLTLGEFMMLQELLLLSD